MYIGVLYLLQAQTAAIAESGGGVLLSGAIRDYLVTFISGDPLIVNCASVTCTSSAIRLTGGTNLFIILAARNAIIQGEAHVALCESCYCLIGKWYSISPCIYRFQFPSGEVNWVLTVRRHTDVSSGRLHHQIWAGPNLPDPSL